MTQPMRIETRVGDDGILTLRVPFSQADANLDVVITIQPKPPVEAPPTLSEWPPGYFERTYGCLADDPLSIPDDPAPVPETAE
jgi:hypothetical protein